MFCSYAIKYFDKYPAPFEPTEQKLPSRAKKLKVQDEVELNFTNLDVVKACYNLLRKNPTLFRNKWNWSTFFKKFYNSEDESIRW